MEIIAAGSLIQLANHFNREPGAVAAQPKVRERWSDARSGRHQVRSAKRALEIAAAVGTISDVGPPGAGKSMLAARLPSILPPRRRRSSRSFHDRLGGGEIVGGALTNGDRFARRHIPPALPALVGGGMRAKPGEISLAHNGVLFLDELPEFEARVLDSLRQPLETGEIAISRANRRVTYPGRFMLVAAMNPCRCGRASEPDFSCKRGAISAAPPTISRAVGPLLDRVDLHIDVPAVTAADLIRAAPAEGSAEVRTRVARAAPSRRSVTVRSGSRCEPTRRPAAPFWSPSSSPTRRARAVARGVRRHAPFRRGYHRVLRVARTLADLDGEDAVRASISLKRWLIGPSRTICAARRDGAPRVVSGHERKRQTSGST